MKRLCSRLTYANVTATLALFLALGGVSYAATQLPAGSVGTKQLKRGAVGTAKIKPRAVTRAKINLASLGRVPNASNADALGGSPPSAFVRDANLLGAVVEAGANLVRGTPGTKAEYVSTGNVLVKFTRDVSKCIWVAGAGNPGAFPLTFGAAGTRAAANGDPKIVQVITWDAAGAQTDMAFHLLVLC